MKQGWSDFFDEGYGHQFWPEPTYKPPSAAEVQKLNYIAPQQCVLDKPGALICARTFKF